MEKNQKYHPVGLLLAEKGLFGLLLTEEGLFAQPLAKKDFSANRWPKSTFRPTVGQRLPLQPTPALLF